MSKSATDLAVEQFAASHPAPPEPTEPVAALYLQRETAERMAGALSKAADLFGKRDEHLRAHWPDMKRVGTGAGVTSGNIWALARTAAEGPLAIRQSQLDLWRSWISSAIGLIATLDQLTKTRFVRERYARCLEELQQAARALTPPVAVKAETAKPAAKAKRPRKPKSPDAPAARKARV